MSRAVRLEALDARLPAPPAPVDPDVDQWPPAYGRERPFLPLLATAREMRAAATSEEAQPVGHHDGDTEATEPERDDEARLAEIARLADSLGAEARAEWCGLRDSFAARLAAAAAAVLDGLIESHAPDLLAARTRDILRRVRAPEIAIVTAPEQLDALRTALQGDLQDQGIPITADPAVAPGQLRLAWQDGGAEIDLAALRRLADQIVSTPPTGATEQEPR